MGNYLESFGKRIYVHYWETEEPKGVIQIIHGMAEHAKRYSEFAEFLNKNGFSVFAIDHRGHGKTKEIGENYGDIGEDGFEMLVLDQHKLTTVLKKKYPSIPIVIFGHSMGSFLAQRYCQIYGEDVSALVLSGSSSSFGMSLYFGKFIAKILMKISNKESKVLHNLTFMNYSKKTEEKTDFSWLTRDSFKVKEYIEDEACGNIFPASFFYYFYDGLIKVYNKKNMEKIPKKIPIYIFSGDKDPVGGYGKRVKKLFNYYKNLKFTIKLKLYPQGRHEMLHELNKLEVYENFLTFLNKNLIFTTEKW